MNNLLSVPTEAGHPNFVNPPKGEVKRVGGSEPLLIDGTESQAFRNPSSIAGRSLQSE